MDGLVFVAFLAELELEADCLSDPFVSSEFEGGVTVLDVVDDSLEDEFFEWVVDLEVPDLVLLGVCVDEVVFFFFFLEEEADVLLLALAGGEASVVAFEEALGAFVEDLLVEDEDEDLSAADSFFFRR